LKLWIWTPDFEFWFPTLTTWFALTLRLNYKLSDLIRVSVTRGVTLLYPVEFLNSLNGNNFPQHKLCLKRGVSVMLLRNLYQVEGLCNSTWLVITVLGDMIIEEEIMTRTHKGKSVLIPRISLTLKNNKWPFVLQRRQYPIKICYSMTINKSQGQTYLVLVWTYKGLFSHMVSYTLRYLM
jgi:hypothetical protein